MQLQEQLKYKSFIKMYQNWCHCINLYFNVGIALVCCTNGLLTTLYLLGINVDPPCNLILTSFMLNVFTNKLMFIPMCVDRFIHIAFPFSYKRTVTTKAIKATIITLWMAAIVISISLYINEPLGYPKQTFQVCW